MQDFLDGRKYTPIAASAPYLEVGLQGYRVRALYDTGSNTTIISSHLAKRLGLGWSHFSGQFRQASGARAAFIGKLGKTSVQIHDCLGLLTEGIRVMDTEDTEMQMIIGTDLFASGLVRERGTTVSEEGDKKIFVEVGKNGVIYEVPLYSYQFPVTRVCTIRELSDNEITLIPVHP